MQENKPTEAKVTLIPAENITDNLNGKETAELGEEELDAVSGGQTTRREPTKHPCKVTVPDLKLGISYQD